MDSTGLMGGVIFPSVCRPDLRACEDAVSLQGSMVRNTGRQPFAKVMQLTFPLNHSSTGMRGKKSLSLFNWNNQASRGGSNSYRDGKRAPSGFMGLFFGVPSVGQSVGSFR